MVKTPSSSRETPFPHKTPAAHPDRCAERRVAVALDSDPSGLAAPRVVAKGRGALAEQILQIAFERGVKVRRDGDLAEILAAMDIDCEVPPEALAAVAEILSYVYRAHVDRAQGAAPRDPGS